MQIQTLQCSNVAPSSSPLVQGVIYGGLIFLSGQLGKNPQTGKLESGFEAETSRVLENLKLLLEEAGSSMDKVLKVTVFLTVADSKHENDPIGLLKRMHPCGYSVLAVHKMQTQTNLLTQGQQ